MKGIDVYKRQGLGYHEGISSKIQTYRIRVNLFEQIESLKTAQSETLGDCVKILIFAS